MSAPTTFTAFPFATPDGYYRRDDDFHRTQVVVGQSSRPLYGGEVEVYVPECLSCGWQGTVTAEWDEAHDAELLHRYYEREEDE